MEIDGYALRNDSEINVGESTSGDIVTHTVQQGHIFCRIADVYDGYPWLA
ncbi:hypothetical protein [Alkalihalobacillus sp. LMS39]|nr:hypothetical protein [Alkalihalobacillus sp. LMS39]UOE95139.1 hypothetical protein MM271_05805 [Alkalihalobacillus sp. LMS39]